jgi:hypothetical protein
MRMGRFRPVHAKSMGSQEVWALLVARKQLLGRLIDVELSIRGIQRAQFYSDWRATLNMPTGEFSVGHVAEPFGNRIGRKMQIERLRWTAITAVQKRRRGAVACRIRVVVLRKFNHVSIARAEYLRASTTTLGINRRSAAAGSGAYSGTAGGSFDRPAGFPLRPFTNQPLPVLFTMSVQPARIPRQQPAVA